MINKTAGFIGGGRVTRIILGGLKKANAMPANVIVSDTNVDVLNKLKAEYPEISVVVNNNKSAALQKLVFLAVHPPVVSGVAGEIGTSLSSDSVLVSLAPKLTIKALSNLLNGFQRIVRMIPNAPSIINKGYNPVVFSQSFNSSEREELLKLFSKLGDCPVVSEETLEAYAIVTAMGPTYLWFQLEELCQLGKSFGLNDEAVRKGITRMVEGAVKLMYESGLRPEEVMDLIPVKPIGDEEANIRNIYRTKLETLFKKLKG
jgi:pyrroline-5-carboxylate reductase